MKVRNRILAVAISIVFILGGTTLITKADKDPLSGIGADGQLGESGTLGTSLGFSLASFSSNYIQLEPDKGLAVVSNLYNPGQFAATLYVKAPDAARTALTVQCYVGDTNIGSVDVTANTANAIAVSFPATTLPNGILNLRADLTVTGLSEVIDRAEAEIAVMPAYQRVYMQELTNRGFSTKYGKNVRDDVNTMIIRSGVNSIRREVEWQWVEPWRGQYYSGDIDAGIKPFFRDGGDNMVYILSFNNTIYSRGDESKAAGTKEGVRTHDNIQGYVNYCRYVAENYPEIKYYEIWNEPNHSTFWTDEGAEQDYAYMMQEAYNAIKEVRPDAIVFGGVTSGADWEFLEAIYNQGGYSYLDGVSFHTYVWSRPNPDERKLEEVTQSYVDLVRQTGGWKPLNLSETGWATHPSATWSADPEWDQAHLLVKQYIVGDKRRYLFSGIHNFYDAERNNEVESHYGVVREDDTAKPAYLALQTYFQYTNGGLYIGNASDGGLDFHIYIQAGEPVAVVWSNNGDTTLTISDSGMEVYDIFDNDITNGVQVEVGLEPVYITGLSDSWVLSALENTILEGLDDFEQAYGHVLSPSIQSSIDNLRTSAASLSYTAADLEGFLDRYFQVAEEVIQAHRAGTFAQSDTEFFGMLYYFVDPSLHISYAYANTYAGSPMASPRGSYQSVMDEIELLEQAVTGGRSQYGRAMADYAKIYIGQADKIAGLGAHSARDGVVHALRGHAGRILELSQAALDLEDISSDSILLVAPTMEIHQPGGEHPYALVKVINHSNAAVEGEIICYPTGTSPVHSAAVAVAAGSSEFVQVPLCASTSAETPYTLRLTLADGTVVDREITTYPAVTANCSGGTSGGSGGSGGGSGGGGGSSSGSGSSARDRSGSAGLLGGIGFRGDNTPALEEDLWEAFIKRIPQEVRAGVSNGETHTAMQVKNANSITPVIAKRIVGKAQQEGGGVYLHADSIENRSVQVRISLYPELVTEEIKLFGSVNDSLTTATRTRFERHFGNKLRVIHFAHSGSIGQGVKIDAKVDLTGMDTDRLEFYVYDSGINTYTRLEDPQYWVDSNGYLRFYTDKLGDVVISEGPLTQK